MKKLLSVLLVFVLMLSVAATSTLSAGATSVEESDLAAAAPLDVEVTSIEETVPVATTPLSVEATPIEIADLAAISPLNVGATLFEETNLAATREIRIFYSDRPYQKITDSSATVYGFLGDSDGDGNVSIIDCTAIQLYLADLGPLSDNGKVVSDVDRDGDVSVMDATEIQLWKAYLSNNTNIARSVYCLPTSTNPDDNVFDIISSYIMKNGTYVQAQNYYVMENIRINNYITILYQPDAEYIMVRHLIDTDDLSKFTSSQIYFHRNIPTFEFFSYELNGDYEVVYTAGGEGRISSFDSYKVSTVCTEFDSISSSSYNDVKQNIESQMCTTLTDIDNLMFSKLPYYFGQLLNSK